MKSAVISLLFLIFWLTAYTSANVEKVIFMGPKQTNNLDGTFSDDLVDKIESLSPQRANLRRRLHSKFSHTPSFQEKSECWLLQEPSEAWILLSGLNEGQRYEVRVCWPATQPTAFDLSLHTPTAIAHSEDLSNSLRTYSVTRATCGTPTLREENIARNQLDGLFLRISANADYFTTDPVLSTEGLLVDVEIILDPYLLNILPQSLLATTAYILIIALAAWYLSDCIWSKFERFARGADPNALEAKQKIG